MKSNRSFLIVLMIFLSALTVNAVTYYVSPTGSSATGTVNSPMSLSAALSKVWLQVILLFSEVVLIC